VAFSGEGIPLGQDEIPFAGKCEIKFSRHLDCAGGVCPALRIFSDNGNFCYYIFRVAPRRIGAVLFSILFF
jgi:hypothetical protein